MRKYLKWKIFIWNGWFLEKLQLNIKRLLNIKKTLEHKTTLNNIRSWTTEIVW